MTGLVRLYPRAWRDRYEDEFLALLEDRPSRMADRFDIVRGAIDARLNPQVQEDPSMSRFGRFPGLAAVLGGLFLILGGISWIQPGANYDREAGGPDGLFATASLLFGPGIVLASIGLLALRDRLPHETRRTANVGLAVALVGFALLLFGNVIGGWLHGSGWWWSAWYIIGVPGLPIGIGLLIFSVAAVRAEMLGFERLLPLALGILAMLGFVLVGDGYARDYGFLAVWSLFGLGWMALGASMASGPGRGSLPPRATA